MVVFYVSHERAVPEERIDEKGNPPVRADIRCQLLYHFGNTIGGCHASGRVVLRRKKMEKIINQEKGITVNDGKIRIIEFFGGTEFIIEYSADEVINKLQNYDALQRMVDRLEEKIASLENSVDYYKSEYERVELEKDFPSGCPR